MKQQPVIEVTATSRGTRFTDSQIERLKESVSVTFAQRYGVTLDAIGGEVVRVANSHRVVWALPRHLHVFMGQPAPAEQLLGVVADALVAIEVDGAVSVQDVVEVTE